MAPWPWCLRSEGLAALCQVRLPKMPGAPTPSPRRHRALATSTLTPLATSFLLPSPVTAPSPPSHCSPQPSCLRIPPATPPQLSLPAHPLPRPRGSGGEAFRGVEPGCTPCPVSSCSPQAAPRGLDKRTGGRLPCQQKTPLLQDTLDPQKGNHSFHRRLLRSHQGRIPDQHFHLGPSGRPFATNGAWIRGSGPRAKG